MERRPVSHYQAAVFQRLGSLCSPVKLLFKNLIFTIIVPGSTAIWIPLLMLRTSPSPATNRYWFAAPLFVIGAVLYAWTTATFALIGRATPFPADAPRKLIVMGPNRFVRNPMYLGVLSVIFAWALLYDARGLYVYGISIAVMFHLMVMIYEEPSLRRQFGDQYADYCKAVKRWTPGRPS
jgi:protein-S-isoprenylcysteine O-methyltransferase Ste14